MDVQGHAPNPEGSPRRVQELGQLGRTMWKRRAEILAYFDTGASNDPVEAINGRLEHLRGIALGFRNLNHYILIAVTDPFRRTPGQDQRTLNPEGPVKAVVPEGTTAGPQQSEYSATLGTLRPRCRSPTRTP